MSVGAITEAKNRYEGRVIPRSRYWTAYWLIGVAYMWGISVALFDFPWWLSLIGIVALFYSHILLLGKYERRSIK